MAELSTYTGGDDEDDGSNYHKMLDVLDQQNDAPTSIPEQTITSVIVEQREDALSPQPTVMTVVGLRAGGPPIMLDLDRRARYVSLQIPAPAGWSRCKGPCGDQYLSAHLCIKHGLCGVCHVGTSILAPQAPRSAAGTQGNDGP
jgi:hypothetical protein